MAALRKLQEATNIAGKKYKQNIEYNIYTFDPVIWFYSSVVTVKALVHGTDIGKDATEEWIQELLHDLDYKCSEKEWNEDEVGTLLSAAGLVRKFVYELYMYNYF